ncbi:hypothetical protein J3458_016194 [Metarhizium acridum]|uniref:uncharacterized protein n=1 Tax=Metarhizium acridum TaxID=92637 RepID=UPI001C6BFB28|nr:hypothetical protein J3458_016194 [Metarhizium acridum]
MPPHDPGGDTPEHFPRETHPPESPSDVSQALNRATQLKATVGVLSSGHIMNFPGAIHDEICFGPSCRVEELAAKLKEVNRFFPHGNSPMVGSAGYLLVGGQGWGATSQGWITKIEMVVPDGRTAVASRTEKQDLFWAARRGGLFFFAVVTRF